MLAFGALRSERVADAAAEEDLAVVGVVGHRALVPARVPVARVVLQADTTSGSFVLTNQLNVNVILYVFERCTYAMYIDQIGLHVLNCL